MRSGSCCRCRKSWRARRTWASRSVPWFHRPAVAGRCRPVCAPKIRFPGRDLPHGLSRRRGRRTRTNRLASLHPHPVRGVRRHADVGRTRAPPAGAAGNAAGTTLCPAADAAPKWAIVIHGGAGVIERTELTSEQEAAYREALTRAIDAGIDVLKRGDPGQANTSSASRSRARSVRWSSIGAWTCSRRPTR